MKLRFSWLYIPLILLFFACESGEKRSDVPLKDTLQTEITETDPEAEVPLSAGHSFDLAEENPEKGWEFYSEEGFRLMETEFGGLQLQMSGDDLAQILSEPAEKEDWVNWGADGSDHANWKYEKKGVLANMIMEGLENPHPEIFSLTLFSPFSGTDAHKIGIGSSREKVLQEYGYAMEDSSGSSLVAGTIYGGIIFSLENDTVAQIFVGAAAE